MRSAAMNVESCTILDSDFLRRKLEIAELLAAGEADIQTGRLMSSEEVMIERKTLLEELHAQQLLANPSSYQLKTRKQLAIYERDTIKALEEALAKLAKDETE
jgi:hypothetical protein